MQNAAIPATVTEDSKRTWWPSETLLSALPRTMGEIASAAMAAFLLPSVSSLLWRLVTGSAIFFRGWINVEYLLLMCLALLYPSRWMAGLLTLELAISIVEPIAHLYYFSPVDAVLSMKYLLFISWFHLAFYAVLLLIYIAGCAATLCMMLGSQRRPFAKNMVFLLLAFVALGVGFDLASGRNIGNWRFRMSGNPDIRHRHFVRAPVTSLLGGMSFDPYEPVVKPSASLPSALGLSKGKFEAASRPNIVLVLTESWGLAQDQRLNDALVEPYRSATIGDRYEVIRGTVPFSGHTTSGETRELCGDSHESSHIMPAGYFAECWPKRLADDGYDTLAVHGFTPSMFNRGEWYRQMGFRESAFLPELQRDGVGLCDGTFPGACDGEVAKWIGSRILRSEDGHPMFVHWVTLNSHLPLPSTAGQVPFRECAPIEIDQQPSLCIWFSRVLTVHTSVAELAATPGLQRTVFVIVGDHAPPFIQSSLRERFSQTKVPYVLLIPKAVSSDNLRIASIMTNGAEKQLTRPHRIQATALREITSR